MKWSGSDRFQSTELFELPLKTAEGSSLICEGIVSKDNGNDRWDAEFTIFVEDERDLIVTRKTVEHVLPSMEAAKDSVSELVKDVIEALNEFIGEGNGI